jgi:hypothetical protein
VLLQELRTAFRESPLYREMAAHTGKGVVPDSTAKRHHFIPRFLLREFATRDGRGLIFQLEKRTGQPRKVTVEAAASRHRFYAIHEEDGTTHNRVEAYLALVESHAAPAVRRLLDDPPGLLRTDAATISHHLALLLARTPLATERIASSVDQTMRLLMSSEFGDEEKFAETYRKAIGPEDPQKIEAMRQRMLAGLMDGSIAFPDERQVGLHYGFHGAGDTAQMIFQMPWVLLRAEDQSGEFITSDTGLAMFDPHPRYPWTGNSLMSSSHAQTTIPLTPTECLVLLAGEPSGTRTVRPASRRDVEDINLRTYGWAHRHIFGRSQEAVTSVRMLARRNRGRVPAPKPYRQVLLFEAEPGDDRLAKEHAARGWPAQFMDDGRPCDYVVLDADSNPVERAIQIHDLTKRRTIKRRGASDLEPSLVLRDPGDLRT